MSETVISVRERLASWREMVAGQDATVRRERGIASLRDAVRRLEYQRSADVLGDASACWHASRALDQAYTDGAAAAVRRRLSRAVRLAFAVERTLAVCHCGRATALRDWGVCGPCTRGWHAAGEPQYCPCDAS